MELAILAALILLNGLFSMSEMAVVSSRKARLQQWADDGRVGAKAALTLANDPSIFLSTIQVGITVVGVTSGAFGEATLSGRLAAWLSQWPALAGYAQGLSVFLVVGGITVASIIVGELVPKRLALRNPEGIASLVARPMRWLSVAAYPLVRALSWVTEAVLKVLGLRDTEAAPVTEAEINVLMEQGTEAGVFEEHEQLLVARVFRLDELKVTGIMTPRNDIVSIDLDEPFEKNLPRIMASAHSRFPATHGGLARVQGIVPAKDLLCDALSGKPVSPAAHLQKPLYLPASITVMEAVEQFKKHRQTMALVVDEYGDVQGLVTLNDVMESLVGDIATLDDDSVQDVVRRDGNSWLMDGGVTIERFKDIVDVSGLPEEDRGNYHTLAGFVLMQLGRIPLAGDKFDWDTLHFEIVDMDGNRVDKVIVTRLAAREDDTG